MRLESWKAFFISSFFRSCNSTLLRCEDFAPNHGSSTPPTYLQSGHGHQTVIPGPGHVGAHGLFVHDLAGHVAAVAGGGPGPDEPCDVHHGVGVLAVFHGAQCISALNERQQKNLFTKRFKIVPKIRCCAPFDADSNHNANRLFFLWGAQLRSATWQFTQCYLILAHVSKILNLMRYIYIA